MPDGQWGAQPEPEDQPAVYGFMERVDYDKDGKETGFSEPIPVSDKQWTGQYADRFTDGGHPAYRITKRRPKKVAVAEPGERVNPFA